MVWQLQVAVAEFNLATVLPEQPTLAVAGVVAVRLALGAPGVLVWLFCVIRQIGQYHLIV
jgi:hypothetical protein